jgi:hypothetical protein
MIVWSGKGLIVPLVSFVVGGLGALLGDILGKQAGWPGDAGQAGGIGAGLMLSGLVLRVLWPKLRSDTRELVDPKTNQRVQLADGSSFFFIPVAGCANALMVLGALIILAVMSGWKPEPSKPGGKFGPTRPVPAPSSTPVPGRI